MFSPLAYSYGVDDEYDARKLNKNKSRIIFILV